MIGILAFGSLRHDPGSELEAVTVERQEVITPFCVEFARYSEKRSGAPTLVPVERGGTHVRATLLVLAGNVLLEDARNILWRRETHQIGTGREYRPMANPGPNHLVIQEIPRFEGLDTVLYVDFPEVGKIRDPSADDLADKAIASARARNDHKDGISYLLRAKASGIETPLMPQYEAKILEKTRASTLEEALRLVRDPNWRS